ncbi:amino acid ABC transporter ATP-binding protein (PAAT family) [Arthrobacter sp. SLBN-100]|uniref:amino acid ABC transporter ATP-binding protein n=1 Tax=Arthrobacter sp. SLBN-100 TaxID=2768450 RepID=UPI00116FA92D|nr:amino acid ABC transporter ATP-binding protein (PAAT family) [Arthrobacter sp. SLBN-100]
MNATLELAAHPIGVEMSDVKVKFGDHEVLHGINLEIPKGRTTCIIGPSGSGKSTLLRCINRLERPYWGQILLGDQDTSALRDDDLRRRIGMVFQHFNLFPHKTVLDNLTMPLRDVQKLGKADADEKARASLNLVGLADKAKFRPDSLSGGQKQRVAIARAIAMEPEIMLFDEATSALDPELVKGILHLMADLSATGMTMVAVTHEMGFAREVADQVVFMDRGRIVEQGSPQKLFDAPESPRLRAFLEQVL